VGAIGDTLIATLRKDNVKTEAGGAARRSTSDAPRDPPTDESAKNLFVGMFFDARSTTSPESAASSSTIRTGLSTSLDQKTLTPEDFYVVIDHS